LPLTLPLAVRSKLAELESSAYLEASAKELISQRAQSLSSEKFSLLTYIAPFSSTAQVISPST